MMPPLVAFFSSHTGFDRSNRYPAGMRYECPSKSLLPSCCTVDACANLGWTQLVPWYELQILHFGGIELEIDIAAADLGCLHTADIQRVTAANIDCFRRIVHHLG